MAKAGSKVFPQPCDTTVDFGALLEVSQHTGKKNGNKEKQTFLEQT
jgi:hypothetical protein